MINRGKSIRAIPLRSIVGLLTLSVAGGAFADVMWNDNSLFFFSTRGSKLSKVLDDVGANYAVPVIASKQIDDVFIGHIRDMHAEQVFDHLSKLYNLAWYYDGQTIYVYKAHEVASQVLTPTYLAVATLMSQLQAASILDNRHCKARIVPASNAMEIYGVPVCIERIAQFAKRIDLQKRHQEENQEVVELFSLMYATAIDTEYSYRSQPVIVPGVVSVLKEMTQGRALPLSQSTGDKTEGAASGQSLPIFSADSRQNAVIIRDRKINIPLYADLIAKLDRKPALVEISVAIIDVNSENLETLGIDFAASASIGGGSVGFNSGAYPSSFSTIVSNTGNFMISLNALTQNAKAEILSRPSIVTLNNVQAVLDRNVTFYTKLVGDSVAKLESISTGSMLRVTPRVINADGHSEIMLTLIIQDGRQTNPISKQEPLPQTLSSEISTQALLKSGQSLLLGGFVQDEKSESVRKIPFLGDLPFIGKLLSSKQKNNRQVVRLFLITADHWGQT